jgi:hypothetical protein
MYDIRVLYLNYISLLLQRKDHLVYFFKKKLIRLIEDDNDDVNNDILNICTSISLHIPCAQLVHLQPYLNALLLKNMMDYYKNENKKVKTQLVTVQTAFDKLI